MDHLRMGKRDLMSGVVAKKLGLKEGVRAIFVNAPASAIESIDPPTLELETELTGQFDYIHFFAASQDEFNGMFPRLKTHLKPTGKLWVSWPKDGQLDTDLSLTAVIKLGYDYGLVESKTIRIDTTWSAIKFTHPKKGKVYKNSYGTLKE
jgi:hypothetical protein